MDYRKFTIPQSDLSYEQRHQTRLAWRNERNLYKRKCDFSGENILSMYGPDCKFPVYSRDVWYSDQWDPCSYGMNFDYSKSFFDQFHELQNKVPRMANIIVNAVNCDYCNVMGFSKNCYLIFGSIECEDCLYGSPFGSNYCLDSLLLRDSQYCYECSDSTSLYECFFCQNCFDSRNLYFCENLRDCKDCFLCCGLRKKKYCILNKEYSKEGYEEMKKKLMEKSYEFLSEKLEILKSKIPHKFMNGINNENASGDYVSSCKNANHCFNCENCEDVECSTQLSDCKDCIDSDYGEKNEHNHEFSGLHNGSNCAFTHWNWNVSNLMYCSHCYQDTKDCFGCICLGKKQYCILNKQYSKDEYYDLVPKIISYMEKTGEWGKFFPIKNSMFPYNKSIAQEYYPLSKNEVLKSGLKWEEHHDHVDDSDYIMGSELSAIADCTEEILKKTIKCARSGRLFRIMPLEFKFYKKYGIRLPSLHPDERHKIRLKRRNPRVLNLMQCSKCGKEIRTNYEDKKNTPVYCEECYLGYLY